MKVKVIKNSIFGPYLKFLACRACFPAQNRPHLKPQIITKINKNVNKYKTNKEINKTIANLNQIAVCCSQKP